MDGQAIFGYLLMSVAFTRPEESFAMPVTRSELLYFCAGAVVGAIGAKNFDKIKSQLGPLLAKAGEAAADAYADAARRVAEHVEAVQDRVAEAKQHTVSGDASAPSGTASTPVATAADAVPV
jgi:hypothetical protein